MHVFFVLSFIVMPVKAPSSSCSAHSSGADCVSFHFQRVKIAVAIVILRDKPSDRTTREFIDSLRTFHQNKEQRLKEENARLKQEVFLLRQQLVLRAHHNSPTFSGSSQGYPMPIYRQQHQPPMPLTPPNSQSSDDSSLSIKSPTFSNDTADPYTNFHRAFFFLEHQLRSRPSDSFLELNVVRHSFLTILEHLDEALRYNRPDFAICLEALQLCVRHLDRRPEWLPSVSDALHRMGIGWLHSFTSNNIMKPFAAVHTLAGSSTFASPLAEIIARRIAESQLQLMEWGQTESKSIPRHISDIVSLSAYYFLLLDKCLLCLTADVDAKKSLSHLLPDALVDLRVCLRFPLFAAAMMRLNNQLSQ